MPICFTFIQKNKILQKMALYEVYKKMALYEWSLQKMAKLKGYYSAWSSTTNHEEAWSEAYTHIMKRPIAHKGSNIGTSAWKQQQQ